MPQANATMNVRRINERTCTIDIHGELNGFAEDVLMQAYTEASTGNIRNIILNFNELKYMNSSGIGLLVTLLIRVNRQGQHLLATGLSDHYKHIFELTRLNQAIRSYLNEAEAIAAANAA